jgi:hypothetical protein
MEKYGFIYVWYDAWRKMYYIGCHWGTVDDGYICSSNRMRDAYRRRPQDFKRRIISKNISRDVLLEEEFKWLSLIPEEELGNKYYNLSRRHFGHWSNDETKRLTVGQKISASPNRGKNISKANRGRVVTEETRRKISTSVSKIMTEEHRKLLSDKTKSLWLDDEYRERLSQAHRGHIHSDEHKLRISQSQIGKKKKSKERTCVHCGITGRGSNMSRYHFDNCTQKVN